MKKALLAVLLVASWCGAQIGNVTANRIVGGTKPTVCNAGPPADVWVDTTVTPPVFNVCGPSNTWNAVSGGGGGGGGTSSLTLNSTMSYLPAAIPAGNPGFYAPSATALTPSGSFTICGWEIPSHGGGNVLTYQKDFGTTGFALGGPYVGVWYVITHNFDTLLSSSTPIVYGQLTLVCGMVDKTGGTIGISINGGAFETTSYGGNTPSFSTGNIFLGQPSVGLLGRWGIWSKVLSSSELTELYNNRIPRRFSEIPSTSTLKTSVNAWWDLDGQSGAQADSSGNGNYMMPVLDNVQQETSNQVVNMVCLGDSLTYGYDGALSGLAIRSYCTQVAPGLSGTSWKSQNYGRNGASTPTIISDLLPLAQYTLNRPETTNLANLWIGTNDCDAGTAVGTIETNITTIVSTLQGYGYKVAILTITPYGGAGKNPGFDACRAALNTWILANSAAADYVIDSGDAAALSDPSNTTYYSTDKLHLTEVGQAVVAALVFAGVSSIAPTGPSLQPPGVASLDQLTITSHIRATRIACDNLSAYLVVKITTTDCVTTATTGDALAFGIVQDGVPAGYTAHVAVAGEALVLLPALTTIGHLMGIGASGVLVDLRTSDITVVPASTFIIGVALESLGTSGQVGRIALLLSQGRGPALLAVSTQNNRTNATFANVTFSATPPTLVLGRTYDCRADFYVTAEATDGQKYDWNGGTVAASSFISTNTILDNTTNVFDFTSRTTALSTAIALAGNTQTVFHVQLNATITTSNDGTLIPRFAKNAAANGNNSSILVGSKYSCIAIP